ncbi:hypothetical protein AB3X94_37200 [Paraburkholderia sp. BR10923]|uniref:phage protein n=1 Tax=Paraburkholderia sp. BR10923 TaxID=3236992 RepID=UPI0034CFAC45
MLINNLRMSFDVRKTIDKNPNPAKVMVYNLTREHMSALLEKRWTVMSLSVGYEALRLIFAGDIVRANVSRDGMDFITELECGDGNTAYSSARVNMVMPAGTTDAEAAVALTSTMPGVTRGPMAVTRTLASARPRVYSGNTRDHLSNLARANGADWSIQDGELTMLPASAVTADEGPLISQDTGMVGMPQQSDDGLEVRCLCNPELHIGGLVRVQSILPHYSGDFKIVGLQHAGDSMEGDWLSTITCVGGIFQKVERKTAVGAGASAGDDIDIMEPDEYYATHPWMPRVYSVDALLARKSYGLRKLPVDRRRFQSRAR